MFVGHEFLAFAIAGWAARRLGADGRAALQAGLVAALAALLPDLDVLYALATYAAAVAGGTPLGWEPFWGVANATHRVVTHTLPTGIVAALAFGAASAVGRRRTAVAGADRSRSARAAAIALVGAAAVGTAVLLSGFRAAVSPAAAVVAGGFLACVAAAGWALAARTTLPTAGVTAAAGVGFVSHPFGDVFLVVPPPLLSPFGPPVLIGRVSLAADPTLHLLGALFVELAAVWVGLAVVSRVCADRVGGGRLRNAIDRRAGVGVAYAPAAVVLPRPTIADAHVLGATVVPFAAAVAAWIAWGARRRAGGTRVATWYRGLVGGVATLTVAGAAYAVTYLFAIR